MQAVAFTIRFYTAVIFKAFFYKGSSFHCCISVTAQHKKQRRKKEGKTRERRKEERELGENTERTNLCYLIIPLPDLPAVLRISAFL